MSDPIPVLDETRILELMGRIDVAAALRRLFSALHAGRAVQPPQTLTLFPEDRGDFITYGGVMDSVFGVKVSPYIVRQPRSLVTAWTLLMSMETGQPLMLCDAKRLTTERTAGTTALAVDLLAPADARRLAIIGSGPVAEAHMRHVLPLRPWSDIRVHSRSKSPASLASFTQLDPRVAIFTSLAEAVADADVVLLCTSSGTPVLDPRDLLKPALIASISTNIHRAHEVPPETLSDMDVYCDYRATTPNSAGEMVLAAERSGWQASSIKGDLAELVAGTAPLPQPGRHSFFRSIGLGLEDIAMALEIRRAHLSQITEQLP